MAYSPSPTIARGGNATQLGRNNGPSPPPLNKREKRKMAFEERFNEIGQTFARNRNHQYWIQNLSLQAGLTYITKHDSYRDRPIDDWPAEIKENVESIINNNVHRKPSPEAAPRAAQLAASYAEEANAAMETRDAQLTDVVDFHNAKIDEFQKDFDYFTRVAMEEHTQLVNTVRDRLIASVSRKRAKLTSGKDQLDALDANALVSNQTSYGLQHPSSPGGPQSNRKTRHTRHRLEVDDMGTIGDMNKRKRKPLGDIEKGSPVRAAEIDVLESSKQEPILDEKPILSINHLFTDRERSTILTAAQRQVVQEVSRERRKAERKAASENSSDVDSDGEDSSEDDAEIQSGHASPGNGHIDIESGPLLAPAMDRTANSSHHATRSSRYALNGSPAQRNPYGDLVGRSSAPKLSAVQRERKKEDDYQRAPALSITDAEQDLLLMRQAVREGGAGSGSFVPVVGQVVRNYVLEGQDLR